MAGGTTGAAGRPSPTPSPPTSAASRRSRSSGTRSATAGRRPSRRPSPPTRRCAASTSSGTRSATAARDGCSTRCASTRRSATSRWRRATLASAPTPPPPSRGLPRSTTPGSLFSTFAEPSFRPRAIIIECYASVGITPPSRATCGSPTAEAPTRFDYWKIGSSVHSFVLTLTLKLSLTAENQGRIENSKCNKICGRKPDSVNAEKNTHDQTPLTPPPPPPPPPRWLPSFPCQSFNGKCCPSSELFTILP